MAEKKQDPDQATEEELEELAKKSAKTRRSQSKLIRVFADYADEAPTEHIRASWMNLHSTVFCLMHDQTPQIVPRNQ